MFTFLKITGPLCYLSLFILYSYKVHQGCLWVFGLHSMMAGHWLTLLPWMKGWFHHSLHISYSYWYFPRPTAARFSRGGRVLLIVFYLPRWVLSIWTCYKKENKKKNIHSFISISVNVKHEGTLPAFSFRIWAMPK